MRSKSHSAPGCVFSRAASPARRPARPARPHQARSCSQASPPASERRRFQRASPLRSARAQQGQPLRGSNGFLQLLHLGSTTPPAFCLSAGAPPPSAASCAFLAAARAAASAVFAASAAAPDVSFVPTSHCLSRDACVGRGTRVRTAASAQRYRQRRSAHRLLGGVGRFLSLGRLLRLRRALLAPHAAGRARKQLRAGTRTGRPVAHNRATSPTREWRARSRP